MRDEGSGREAPPFVSEGQGVVPGVLGGVAHVLDRREDEAAARCEHLHSVAHLLAQFLLAALLDGGVAIDAAPEGDTPGRLVSDGGQVGRGGSSTKASRPISSWRSTNSV